MIFLYSLTYEERRVQRMLTWFEDGPEIVPATPQHEDCYWCDFGWWIAQQAQGSSYKVPECLEP